ncbi:DUF3311 domain-containing protein [Natronosalvus halobius]|uniref:DUF3311 domain-containing protein n=1 Tax=Natronosalvus halobius TaxID=2953746 RepID=UPI00209CE4AF|nr:DUF3311 domain-containing protein [Natronosalvus halobius]USZ71215.1 DUF3311 domain-containing protein [Natronosalvus halobius]
MNRLERIGWILAAVLVCLLGIPWFLWGNAATAFGLPLWLWWHVGWLALCSVLFWTFAQRAWGVGIEPNRPQPRSRSPRSDGRADGRGDRR